MLRSSWQRFRFIEPIVSPFLYDSAVSPVIASVISPAVSLSSKQSLSDVLSKYFFMIGSKDLSITDALELSRHLIAAPLPRTAATICERAVRATVRIGTTKCTSQEELYD
jgi:hypothetical protein